MIVKKISPSSNSDLHLERGVYDLLFAQFKTGHWWLLPLVFFIVFVIRENIQTSVLFIWLSLLIVYLFISDVFIFRAYDKRWLNPEDNQYWSRLLTSHNLILGCFLGVIPPLCAAQTDQFIIISIAVITCSLIIGGASILAAHLYSYIAWSLPQLLGLILFINQQQNSKLLLLIYFAVVIFIIGTAFAINARRLIYSSVGLHIHNQELIKELTEKQNIAVQAIEDKSRFLAAASHDLRQPLHALGLFVESLSHLLNGEKEKKILNNIEQSTDALQHLFNALLDISKLDAGAIEVDKRHFELNKILEKIELEFQSLAQEKGINLTIERSNQIVYSDKILSERILRNLVSNAIKYTTKGAVKVDVMDSGGLVKISVNDTGIGIDEDELDTIFREFYQVNNTERDRSKGLGLGLSIVRRLVDLLSLDMTVTSSREKGTTFTVTFPKGDVTQISNVPLINTGGWDKFEELQILVIDDDTQVRDSMFTMLNDWGSSVKLADSLDATISYLNDGYVPDLILSDFRLSDDSTGIDVIHRIREHVGEDISALLISGDTAPESLQEAKQAGIRLLHKPIKAAKLRVAINYLLNEKLVNSENKSV